MKPIVNKAKNFQEAEKWDITQQINMTPEERQKIAKKIRERFYGKKVKDVRNLKRKQ